MDCKAITHKGSRCIKFGYYNGFCKIHCPTAKKDKLEKEILKTSTKLKSLNIQLKDLNYKVYKQRNRKRSRKQFEDEEIFTWDWNDTTIKSPPKKKRRLNPKPTLQKFEFKFEFIPRNSHHSGTPYR